MGHNDMQLIHTLSNTRATFAHLDESVCHNCMACMCLCVQQQWSTSESSAAKIVQIALALYNNPILSIYMHIYCYYCYQTWVC